jgi:hypothetical protein
MELYDLPYSELKEAGFECDTDCFLDWQELIHLIDKDFKELWECGKMVMPNEMQKLREEGFKKENWHSLLIEICGAGVLRQHNCFFRIRQFLQTKKNKVNGRTIVDSALGKQEAFENYNPFRGRSV